MKTMLLLTVSIMIASSSFAVEATCTAVTTSSATIAQAPVSNQTLCTVGELAPDFTLPAIQGGKTSTVKLSELRGEWVVLFFYPADFTYVCPTEIVAMAEINDNLKEMGVVVLAISVDNIDSHKRWDAEVISLKHPGGAPFPLLADSMGEVGRMYGAYNPRLAKDLRGQFIIDPDGIVQAALVLNDSVGRNTDELIRQIRAFMYVRDTRGTELTPVNWKPGEQGIKPGNK